MKKIYSITISQTKKKCRLLLLLFGLILLQGGSALAQITSQQSGNWTDPNTWGGSVPTNAESVTIANGHTVNNNTNGTTPAEYTTLTIEAGATLSNSSGAVLAGTTIINNGDVSSFNNTLNSAITNNGTWNWNNSAFHTTNGSVFTNFGTFNINPINVSETLVTLPFKITTVISPMNQAQP